MTDPVRYAVLCGHGRVNVIGPENAHTFRGSAAAPGPKIYVVLKGRQVVYVGATLQRIATRLRQGVRADGQHGYHGYRWFIEGQRYQLDLWFHDSTLLDLETIEAELVYLIRMNGQWPRLQTEIHFHPSKSHHRKIAKRMAAAYGLDS
jgi:hypothetical protein